MISTNSILRYKLCIKCDKELAIEGGGLCKECRPKSESNRTLNKNLSKVYLHKFGTKNSSNNKGSTEEAKITAFHCSIFRMKKEISIRINTNEPTSFFTLYWDQFKDFDSLSSFITKSDKIGASYFALNSFEIQKKPKYQKFIQSKEKKLPDIIPQIQLILSVPLSRPLQLLTQKSYWDGLIANYFQYVHPITPLFSVHSFNSKTPVGPLLSAVYYGGFQFMTDKPEELVKYFKEYANLNIKEATRSISLQNAQATLLYSFLMLISGNIKLFRYCQAHSIRMSYALGLHLNTKKLAPIQQYDRFKLFSTVCELHISFYGMDDLALNQLTEFGDCNIDQLGSGYQIPNSNCAFYLDTEDENVLYGVCTDMFFSMSYKQTRDIWTLSKCNENSVHAEFIKIFNSCTQKYLKCMSTYDILLEKLFHLKSKIQNYKHRFILNYHTMNLELYRIFKSKVKKLSSDQISKMLEQCIILFDTIIENQKSTQIAHFYPYTAGLNFISIYSIANSNQKSLIKEKLGELLDFLSNRAYEDKLSYLVIKNEFDSILKSK